MKELLDKKRREFLAHKNNMKLEENVRISNSKLFNIFNNMFHQERYEHQDEVVDNLITELHMLHLQTERLKERNVELSNELKHHAPKQKNYIPSLGLNEGRRFD